MSAQATCTCNGKPTHKQSSGTTFYPTIANKEDVCIYCGHYVVWKSQYDLFPKSNKGIGGYAKVTSKRVPEKGWNQEQIVNYFEDTPGGYIGHSEVKITENNYFNRQKDKYVMTWNAPTNRQKWKSKFKKENEE